MAEQMKSNESEEYIKAYDVPPMFGTYEELMKGAPGKTVK
jgi:hypothetical protein